MTALPNIDGYQTALYDSEKKTAAPPCFAVDETYWGYVVRCTEAEPAWVQLAQGAAWFAGICMCIATLGLWIVPMSHLASGILPMKLGATFILSGIAVYFLWYASRGTQSELQIDTSLGEMREIVRNQAGRPTLLGRHGFDAIGGIMIDRSTLRKGRAGLALRFGNSAQLMPVAWGLECDLAALRDRMCHDMMISPTLSPRQDHTVPAALVEAA
jgi:hypothetical protein